EAKISGLESDITYLLTPDWTVATSFSYNQAELAKDLVIGANYSPSGTQLPNVPEFKGNITSRYHFMVDDFEGHAQFVFSHVGETRSNIYKFTGGDTTTDTREINGSYQIINLSMGIDNENWGVSFYVSNLTDERAQLTRGTAGWDSAITTNRPRTIGIKYHMIFE
ncbi:MAG: TonB-dependent receptor, partial [Paraglaciecola sp.]|nr:TonB-dependent receptor [Paraglaciecola sp.]